MAGRGETLKMFVVQRTFRTVRKGYDPDEVDRHLELVSRWFTQTDAAKALREERERIQERERAAAEREAAAERSLEGVRMEAEATLEGAHRRAAAEEHAAREDRAAARAELEAAREQAERILAEAAAGACELREAAAAERATILDSARIEADAAAVLRVAREATAEAER